MMNFHLAGRNILDDVQFSSKHHKSSVEKLLKYMEQNTSIHYFPMSVIKHVSECEDKDECLQIATFLCGDYLRMLRPVYAYIDYDDNEILLSKDDFRKALRANTSFMTEEGVTIEGFKRNRLNFYFVRYVEDEEVELDF